MNDLVESVRGLTTQIYKHSNGVHYTKVLRDGVLMYEVETPPSQIREPRETMLWKPEMGRFSVFKQHNNQNVSMYTPLKQTEEV